MNSDASWYLDNLFEEHHEGSYWLEDENMEEVDSNLDYNFEVLPKFKNLSLSEDFVCDFEDTRIKESELEESKEETPDTNSDATKSESCHTKIISSRDEPAVLLVAEDENFIRNVQVFPPETGTFTQNSKDEYEEEGDFDMIKFFMSTFSKLKSRQDLVDRKMYSRKGPGRRRKYDPRTSEELRDLVMDYLRTNLGKIVSNSRCISRKDALITIAARSIKKLTYFLVEKCSAKNQYKKSTPSSYLFSFLESFSSFLSSIDCHDCDIAKSFAEYIIIYFPENKASHVLEHFI
mmetsp:Transcript_32648/g.28905  ORF Transcript_32648/g.28905 Transcript_32648/m.28905 type:complete len:291 (-) Transcript_32648:261-1133(-)